MSMGRRGGYFLIVLGDATARKAFSNSLPLQHDEEISLLKIFSLDKTTLEKGFFFIVDIISCLNISSWFSPSLGTISLPTTTLVMKDRDAIIASSLYNKHC